MIFRKIGLPMFAGMVLCGQSALAQTAAEKQTSQATIWSLEQSIYAGRAKADLSNYQNNMAQNYLSWPPGAPKPIGHTKVTNNTGVKTGLGREKLDMEFADFTQQNDMAIIYYWTHRTMLADGAPVDERFQVTHTWIKENGSWRVLGGMARQVLPASP